MLTGASVGPHFIPLMTITKSACLLLFANGTLQVIVKLYWCVRLLYIFMVSHSAEEVNVFP